MTPSTTKMLSLSNPVIKNFSRLECWLFSWFKLSLLIWSGVTTGDSWFWWVVQNFWPGAGWLVQPLIELTKI